jgi:MFS family permease
MFLFLFQWPQWQKELILLIIGLSAAVVGAFGPMLSPGFVQISAELDISVNTLSQATAWLTMTLGVCVFFINPVAKIYGKRPIYIFASVVMFVTSIWAAASSSYDSFLAARIVSALGMAPYEILVLATIKDLYFVHERGTRIAVWNLFLMCGIAGGSLISGYIIQNLGFRWTFWICAILFGVLLVAIVLFVPESTFLRPSSFANLASSTDKTLDEHVEVEDASVEIQATATSNNQDNHTPKQTYLSSLRIFTGKYSSASPLKIFARPFILFFYPAVFWGFLLFGITLTWIVVFSVVNGVIFVAPPYNFSISETGLISLSPFILTLIGEVVSGPLNDWICIWLTNRNRGIYEPEFRLPLVLIVAILGAAGFFGFGATVHFATHWSGPVLTFGLANMSMAFASTSVFGYVIDCYPQLSEEVFVSVNARNLLTFGFTYFVNSWLEQDGALVMFSVLGGLFLFVCFLTLPMWVFGKRIRSRIGRTQWLQEFMKDED